MELLLLFRKKYGVYYHPFFFPPSLSISDIFLFEVVNRKQHSSWSRSPFCQISLTSVEGCHLVIIILEQTAFTTLTNFFIPRHAIWISSNDPLLLTVDLPLPTSGIKPDAIKWQCFVKCLAETIQVYCL